jgi:hypothetical protein
MGAVSAGRKGFVRGAFFFCFFSFGHAKEKKIERFALSLQMHFI